MSLPPDFMLSVLVVIDDDLAALRDTLPRLTSSLEEQFRQYEVILVDNASDDGSGEYIVSLMRDTPNMRYLRLTRHHAREIAMTCALDQAIGDIAVTFDMVEDDIGSIPPLVEVAAAGDVAIAKNARHHGVLHRMCAKTFYWLVRRTIGVRLNIDDGNQRAYPRSAMSALAKIKSKRRHTRLFNLLIGIPQRLVDVPAVRGRRKESLVSSIEKGIDLICSNSLSPLRWAAWIGCLSAMANLVYLGYVLLVAFIKSKVAEGWITLSLMTTLMFLILFVILAVLSEYVGRIMEEVQDRPLYFIEFEKDSGVRTGKNIVNVV